MIRRCAVVAIVVLAAACDLLKLLPQHGEQIDDFLGGESDVLPGVGDGLDLLDLSVPVKLHAFDFLDGSHHGQEGVCFAIIIG